jgi:hypothetical protein
MYPDLETARHRIAELHHQALHADLAIAIRRARRPRSDRSRHAMPARLARAARRMLALDRTRASRGPASSAGRRTRLPPDTSRTRTMATARARLWSRQAHASPGCMPPTAPGTPRSAPQGRRTPKHQHPRRTAVISSPSAKSAGRARFLRRRHVAAGAPSTDCGPRARGRASLLPVAGSACWNGTAAAPLPVLGPQAALRAGSACHRRPGVLRLRAKVPGGANAGPGYRRASSLVTFRGQAPSVR